MSEETQAPAAPVAEAPVATDASTTSAEKAPNENKQQNGSKEGTVQEPVKGEPVKTDEPGKDGAAKEGASKEEASAEINLNLPKEIDANDKVVAGIKSIAKEFGLKAEGAQKLADLYASRMSEAQVAADQRLDNQISEWKEQVRTDKEVGGAKLEANRQIARSAIARFGDDELKKLIDGPFGDHPALVRAFYRIGKAFGEDRVAGSTSGGAQAISDRDSKLRALYPTMYPKET